MSHGSRRRRGLAIACSPRPNTNMPREPVYDAFWWGSSITPDQAAYNSTAAPYRGGGRKGGYRAKTVPVNSFKPNPWGLYQVHGNVCESVPDCWNGNYSNAPTDGFM